MSTQSDVSLPPYPNEPLIQQQRQARAAETVSSFWSMLALIGPNYIGQPVKTTNRAKIVRFYYLPEQSTNEPEKTIDEPIRFPSFSESFIGLSTVSVEIPEMWLVVLDLPHGARLVVRTTKRKYQQLKDNSDQSVSVDYQIGRFDGVPKIKPAGKFFRPPSPHHIVDYQLIPC